jgi:hypothetical protein
MSHQSYPPVFALYIIQYVVKSGHHKASSCVTFYSLNLMRSKYTPSPNFIFFPSCLHLTFYSCTKQHIFSNCSLACLYIIRKTGRQRILNRSGLRQILFWFYLILIFSWMQIWFVAEIIQTNKINLCSTVHKPFKPWIKSHLLFAGIII